MSNPSTSSQHIYLIEDDDGLRTNLSSLLDYLGFTVHAYADPQEFMQVPTLARPAVLVCDVMMPSMTGLEVQEHLLAKGSLIPMIFISGESSLQQGVLAMKRGAIEFLVKPFQQEDLLEAIHRGLANDVANLLHEQDQLERNQALERLAPRERAVFELLIAGSGIAEIAEALSISTSTTKQYKAQILEKLQLRSLSDLIALDRPIKKAGS